MVLLVDVAVCSGRGADAVVPGRENVLPTIRSRRLYFARVSQMSVGTA